MPNAGRIVGSPKIVRDRLTGEKPRVRDRLDFLTLFMQTTCKQIKIVRDRLGWIPSDGVAYLPEHYGSAKKAPKKRSTIMNFKVVIPRPECLRRMSSGFGWVDHRLVRQGYTSHLSAEAQAL